MTTELHSLWASHFIIRRLELSSEDNAALAALCREFYAGSMGSNGANSYRSGTESIYGLPPTPALRRYFDQVRAGLAMYLSLYGLKLEDVDAEFDGFANVETHRQWATAHAHVNNQLVVTYYPHVYRAEDEHPRGGCLYWLSNDPKMGNWMMRRENQHFEIKPETGTQVIFPGHAKHATNPLFGVGSEKVALVTNIRLSDPKSRGMTKFLREEEIFASMER